MAASPATKGAEQLSIVRLSSLHESVLCLRGHLRAALLDESPRMEMSIYAAFYHLYREYYYPFYCARQEAGEMHPFGSRSNGVGSLSQAEIRFAVSAYMQDLLAACLCLIEPASVSSPCEVTVAPPECDATQEESNHSRSYVSAAQRKFCRSVFFYTCWSADALPLHDVLQALYPLLDPGLGVSSSGCVASSVDEAAAAAGSLPPASRLENGIAAKLFSQKRFASRRRLVSATLNGLVLTRNSGIVALLRVLLLNDRVAADMTREATHLVVSLLASSSTSLWRRATTAEHTSSSSTGWESRVMEVVHIPKLTVADHIAYLSHQLVPLMEERTEPHEDVPESLPPSSATGKKSAFLERLGALEQRLPAETVEDRLHLFIVTLLNALVTLPPRDRPDFPSSYRRFYHVNRLLLSSAFQPLSLHGEGPYAEKDVVAALQRLRALFRGVALGAGRVAISRVMPATAAGLLNLFAVVSSGQGSSTDTTTPALALVRSVLGDLVAVLLADSSMYELCARSFVMACSKEQPHAYTTGDAVQKRLSYGNSVCTRGCLSAGLAYLLFHTAATFPCFVRSFVAPIAEACEAALCDGEEETRVSLAPLSWTEFSPNLITESVEEGASAMAEGTALLDLLERLALEAPPAALFGTHGASLASTIELLGRLAGLSGVLYRWSVSLLDRLLTAESIEVHLHSAMTDKTAGRAFVDSETQTLGHLQRCCRKVMASFSQLSGAAQGPAVLPFALTDAGLGHMTTQVCEKLTALLERIDGLLTASHAVSSTDKQPCALYEERVRVVQHDWHEMCEQIHSALDCRAAVDVAVNLTKLALSVDDVIFDIADPQPLRDVTWSVLRTLVRVLYETDEVSAAVRAIHCVTWLVMYRFDSGDSAYLADLIFELLAETQEPPSWLLVHGGGRGDLKPAIRDKFSRLRVRLLDVLLSLTDYDGEHRTLRNVDDVLQRMRHTSLYDLLANLCRSTQSVIEQVAALHLMGPCALALQPRVSIPVICELCRDVFRLSSHAMAKAACAATLGKFVAALCQSSETSLPTISKEEIEMLQSMASAMASYRGPARTGERGSLPERTHGVAIQASETPSALHMHDAVIQNHGRTMQEQLKNFSIFVGGVTPVDAALQHDLLRIPELRRR